MANTKISQLTALNNPTGSEELVYAYNNSNGKMTLNTMKSFANTGQQAELVSGTNIKTINNQSILWAGNIDIQWGGGWAWADAYDAIVDASGDGDYTTIGAAVDDNKRNIFVKDWTYNETQWHFITLSAVDKVIIHWQSTTWVVVNITLSSVPTQWGDSRNYPAFLFLDGDSSTNLDVNISNITFNVTVNSDQVSSFLVKMRYTDSVLLDANVSHCKFNVSNDWSDRMFFTTIWQPWTTALYWKFDISDCIYVVTSNTANMFLEEWALANDMNVFKNCSIVAKANSNNEWRCIINNASDCNITYDKTNMWKITFRGTNISDSNIDLWANINAAVPFDISLNSIRNCVFEARHAGSYSPKNIWTASIIPDWQAATSYSVGDQVLNGWLFYECNEAHTSASSWYTDNEDEKWDTVATIVVKDATWCTIYTWDTISLGWKIKWNSFNMGYDSWDILVPYNCIFEWNSLAHDSYSHNMYVNEHSIINGNVFWDSTSSNNISIYYVSTTENIITNNILYSTSLIKKIWSWTGGIVDNNASWSV